MMTAPPPLHISLPVNQIFVNLVVKPMPPKRRLEFLFRETDAKAVICVPPLKVLAYCALRNSYRSVPQLAMHDVAEMFGNDWDLVRELERWVIVCQGIPCVKKPHATAYVVRRVWRPGKRTRYATGPESNHLQCVYCYANDPNPGGLSQMYAN